MRNLLIVAFVAILIASTPQAQEAIPRYLSGPINIGTKPTNTGSCAIGTQLGGMAAGSFLGTGICAAAAGGLVLNFKNLPTSGWTCTLHDLTTPADAINQTAYVSTPSSATVTATFTATWAASDLITYHCAAF